MKFSLVLFKYDTVGRCGFAKFKDFSLAISLANHNLQLMKMPRFLSGSAIIPPKVIIHSSFKVKWKNTLTCVTMSLHRSDIDLPFLFAAPFRNHYTAVHCRVLATLGWFCQQFMEERCLLVQKCCQEEGQTAPTSFLAILLS